MTSARLEIRNPSGLHARPAALFVRTAGAFSATIHVRNISRARGPADAKSLLSLLTLGVSQGHEIEVTADGADEAAAVETLSRLVAEGIGEEVA